MIRIAVNATSRLASPYWHKTVQPPTTFGLSKIATVSMQNFYGTRLGIHVIDTLVHTAGHSIKVEVDPVLVHSNEINSLCGSSAKLQALLVRQGYTRNNRLQKDVPCGAGWPRRVLTHEQPCSP